MISSAKISLAIALAIILPIIGGYLLIKIKEIVKYLHQVLKKSKS